MSDEIVHKPVKKPMGIGAKIGIGCGDTFLFLIILGGITSAVGSKSSSTPVDSGSQTAQARVAPEITAIKIHQAYKQNEIAADEQYKGKVFNISGIVEGIQKDLTDSIFVTIKTGDEFGSLHANFDDAHKATIAKLKPGQPLKIQGSVDGFLMQSVMVKDCQIVP